MMQIFDKKKIQSSRNTWSMAEENEILTHINGLHKAIGQMKEIHHKTWYRAPELSIVLNSEGEEKTVSVQSFRDDLDANKMRIMILWKVMNQQEITIEEKQMLLAVKAIAESEVIQNYGNVLTAPPSPTF